MTEPYTGPAPDLNSPQGTQPQPQLTPEQQTGNGLTPPSGEPAQPSIEDLQRRATEYEKRFTDTQQAYTQSQQELARLRNLTQQLVGNQVQPPPQDPVQQYADALVSKNPKLYDQQMARDIAEMNYRMTQDAMRPLQQQTQIAQQAANIDYSIQQAAQQWPQLFTSQQEYTEARQAALYLVQNGGVADARSIAAIVNDNRFFRQPNGSPAPVQPAAPAVQPFANGMYQTRPGFTQPSYQSAPQQLTPDQQVAENFIQSYLKKP